LTPGTREKDIDLSTLKLRVAVFSSVQRTEDTMGDEMYTLTELVSGRLTVQIKEEDKLRDFELYMA
jgi:hypothetical protein